jgi:prolipoprotein diacylglyceryl transferase
MIDAIVWDPELGIKLGNFTIRYYSLMYVIGFVAGYYIMKAVFKREKESEELLDPLLMYIFLGVILGARLGHVFFYDWPYFKHHLAEILLPVQFEPEFHFTCFRGLASHGATIGIAIAAFLFWRKYKNIIRHKSFLWWADRLILTIPLGGAAIRVGNLINSEIVGKPTGNDYGFIFKALGENFPRHPVQLYEASAYAVLFILVMYLYWKTKIPFKYPGLLFGIFFSYLWLARFILEFWKRPQREIPSPLMEITGLTMGQILSVPMFLVGIYFIYYGLKHAKSEL